MCQSIPWPAGLSGFLTCPAQHICHSAQVLVSQWAATVVELTLSKQEAQPVSLVQLPVPSCSRKEWPRPLHQPWCRWLKGGMTRITLGDHKRVALARTILTSPEETSAHGQTHPG